MITATIDPDSPVPPFEQLRSQLDVAIRSGLLGSGTRLPSIRQLAGDLSLAPNTVARAYRELEETGLVAGRGRRGTIVMSSEQRSTGSSLGAAARAYLDRAHDLGFTTEDAVAILGVIG